MYLPRKKIFDLFNRAFEEAREELLQCTRNMPLSISHKVDRTVVTECDKAIDAKISRLVTAQGIPVVSEEGAQSESLVHKGTYCTIDPIDGTIEYIECVENAVSFGNIKNFLQPPTLLLHDFTFLIGLVQNGVPVYGGCYHYVTEERIFIDAQNKYPRALNSPECVVQLDDSPVVYIDTRRISMDSVLTSRLEKIVNRVPRTRVIRAGGSGGLNALRALLSGHADVLVFQPLQAQGGLWDLLPAAVAASTFGGEIFDGAGKPLKFTSYVMLQGPGWYVLKGDKFRFVIDEI